MYADIEALVLSGELFNGPSGTNSPPRSPSPDRDPGWHDEEYELAMEEQRRKDQALDYDSDDARRDAIKAQAEKQNQPESIGMGPGRTGVKGVIRDRNEAVELEREKKAKEMQALREKMEKTNLGGKTYLEEEREKAARGEKADQLVELELEKYQQEPRRDALGRAKEGRFGHLREVGLKGFLNAVEKEERGIWVVVHLFDPSLDRCYAVDETLSRLARQYPDTKFLRARAAALGFASNTTSLSKRPYQHPHCHISDSQYPQNRRSTLHPLLPSLIPTLPLSFALLLSFSQFEYIIQDSVHSPSAVVHSDPKLN
ncbi:hypothetical protein NMY22_g18431 [Coprinellus aureogranulatus]|nr:hypothetical protein NMY22_g18431 [Coprinellus aureogranulatus]